MTRQCVQLVYNIVIVTMANSLREKRGKPAHSPCLDSMVCVTFFINAVKQYQCSRVNIARCSHARNKWVVL